MNQESFIVGWLLGTVVTIAVAICHESLHDHFEKKKEEKNHIENEIYSMRCSIRSLEVRFDTLSKPDKYLVCDEVKKGRTKK